MSDFESLPGSQELPPPEPAIEVAAAVEPEIPKPDPFWNWGDFFIFLFLLIPSFGLASVITALTLLLLQIKTPNMVISAIPAQFLGYAFGLTALWFLLKTRYQQPLWRSLGWRWDGWLVVPMLSAGVGLAILVVLVSVLLKTKPVNSPIEEAMKDPMTALVLALFAVTLGPICEELLFRGFLQPLAVRSFGLAAGILIPALPFALLHGPQYKWSWQHILLILIAGCVFGLTRYRTKSTAMAACMHAGYNFTFFTLVIFQRGIL